MTTEQKNRIVSLRRAGDGYATIAQKMDMPKSTISNYCRKNGLGNIVEGTEKKDLLSPVHRVKLEPAKKQGIPKVPAFKVTTVFADQPNEAAVAEALRILTNV